MTAAELPPLLEGDDQLLRPRDAAMLRVSEPTLRTWRREGRGPPIRRHGTWMVFYALKSAARTAA